MPVLECLPDAGVLTGIVGELGSGGEIGTEIGLGLVAEASPLFPYPVASAADGLC
jgi:hypothetical protein